MADPPVFQRSPRLKPELPSGETVIPAPKAAPSEPGMSSLSALWTLLPGLLGAVVMYGFSRASGHGSLMYLGLSLPMMAGSYLVQIGHLYAQKRKYERDVRERQARYRTQLETNRQHLQGCRDQQQNALRQMNPDATGCLARAERLDARLWERSLHDSDFLSIRLGLGSVPFAVAVKVQGEPAGIDIDPLCQEALNLAAGFRDVPGVPICLPLRELGAAGLAGPRPAVVNIARNIALQIATHHSPDEVKIAALFPAEEADEWAWLRWLPHTWSDGRDRRFLAAGREGAHQVLTDLYDLLSRRKAQLATHSARPGAAGPPLPCYVCFVADPRLVENQAAMPLLLQEGAHLGAFTIVLAGRKEELPMECQGIVTAGSGSSQLILVPAQSQSLFHPDDAPPELAERTARALAPVRLQRLAASTEIPRQVTLLELLGVARVAELDVPARWRESEPHRSLAVPIGARTGGEQLLFDLHERAHGPHGLVAGATGSGKSELLQTLIVAMAVQYHPHELAFVMVDYKGGGMANAFQGLPHLVGTITNLEGGLARRALSALKAELKRRQRLLGEAGVNHIDAYIRSRRQGRRLEPLPHLIVVVDEFAELKAEQPDFMRELISAVRVGRSLGVHLILATQKPAGVVDEQIWSNTRFRLCLRVERPEDSQEVLRCPDAAGLTGAGRGYFQVGNNERFELFQAGWGGAPYLPDRVAPDESQLLAEVGLDGQRYRFASAAATDDTEGAATQLHAMVAHLSETARQAGIRPLDGPWLPPLPELIPLSALRPAGEGWDGRTWRESPQWMAPVAALVDDPENQCQTPLRVSLGKEGHLAVYGAPGTGKTTLVQTLVTSLALSHSPHAFHCYLLDCSGRILTHLAGFPHVGAVVTGDEKERVHRLLRHLLQELEARKERLARLGVNTLSAYLQAGGEPLPAILFVLDNYPAFTAAFEEAEEQVAQLAREGGNHGIHLVLTANSPSLIRSRVASNLSLAVTLNLADRGDYVTAVGRTGGLEPAPLPGRGLVKGSPPLEFQVALPVEAPTDWERTNALKALMAAMEQAWTGARPRPVNVLPEVVPLCDLCPPAPADGWGSEPGLTAAIGLEVESLAPFAPDLREGPHFLISGPPASGKTTLLQTWLLSLAERLPPDRLALWLVDGGAGGLAPLQHLPQVRGYVGDMDALGECAGELELTLQERRRALEEARRSGVHDGRDLLAGFPALVVAIDNYDLYRAGAPDEAKRVLEEAARRDRALGLHFLVAGPSGVLNRSSYEGLIQVLLELPTGFILGSNDHADLQLFNLRPLTGQPGRMLPPGQGYYSRRGLARPIKAATPHAGDLRLQPWVERISSRCSAVTREEAPCEKSL